MAEGKPSFISSTLRGIAGSIKGALVGGGVGAALGALVGIGIAVATSGLALPAILGGAALGATLTSIPMAAIGALSGTVTEVVASRQAAEPSANDVVSVAKVAYAQGVSVGRQMEQEQSKETESTKWRDRYAQEQAAKAVQSHTIH